MTMQDIRSQLTDCKTTDRYVVYNGERYWVFGAGSDSGLLVRRIVGNTMRPLMSLDWGLVESVEPAPAPVPAPAPAPSRPEVTTLATMYSLDIIKLNSIIVTATDLGNGPMDVASVRRVFGGSATRFYSLLLILEISGRVGVSEDRMTMMSLR